MYKDTARLTIGARNIQVAFGDFGTPIYYKENNNNEVTEFKVDSKLFKYKGELFFAPNISKENHSFTKLESQLLSQIIILIMPENIQSTHSLILTFTWQCRY